MTDLNVALDAHSIVAYTDPTGIITEVNDKFIELSKYSREELIGAPQSIVKSGHHPPEFFRTLWRTISRGKVWQGEICNRAKDGSEYWVATTISPLFDDAGAISGFISLRTETTQLHQARRELQKSLYYDEQTGLPSYAHTIEHLSNSALGPDTAACGFILAGFEDLPIISDSFGHGLKDQLLSPVADQFTEIMERDPAELRHSPLSKKPDLISRVGASTFGAAFSGITGSQQQIDDEVRRLAEEFRNVLEDIVRVDLGVSISSTLRVGYVTYRPGQQTDGVELFGKAEFAMRHAELSAEVSSAAPIQFGEEVVQGAHDRTSLLRDLREGIFADQLRLHLQPIVDADRRVRCYEALVRWQHPERGLVQPDEFIPLAETTGLIMSIGEWVLNEACRILAEWARIPERSGCLLSVNVSGRQLQSGVLVQTVRDTLLRNGAPAALLGIEVTESMMNANIGAIVATLHELRELGVRVSLDDFGTGYSSLSRLTGLPVDQLKIDREFVAPAVEGSRDAAILGAIIHLGRAMNLDIVAEGVETEQQFAMLAELGIDGYQGFLFGRARPLNEL